MQSQLAVKFQKNAECTVSLKITSQQSCYGSTWLCARFAILIDAASCKRQSAVHLCPHYW